MPRNVELKAKLADVESVLQKAKELSSSDGEIVEQCDVFFNVPNGRLKLRYLQGGEAVLVFYKRDDTCGPKLSVYEVVSLTNGKLTEDVLTSALGKRGVVKKTRRLFLVGQTRVHIDNVEHLGDYMELEVMLQDTQSPDDGQAIAESLMKQLGVSKDALVRGAYLDHLGN